MAAFLLLDSTLMAQAAGGDAGLQRRFDELDRGPWKNAFEDPGTADWQGKWFLDGEVATVENTLRGIEMTSGPETRNDAHHGVLWTKRSFVGDVKIEYDFTRLDSAAEGVDILYIQATGSGKGPYAEDIAQWADLRKVPAMKMYYDHMHTYHVSYAVGYPGSEYVRLRRYKPEATGLKGTEILPDYGKTDLFQTGTTYRMTLIKSGQEIFLRVRGGRHEQIYHWKNETSDPIVKGHIGLRQMWGKHSRYANFRVDEGGGSSGVPAAVTGMAPELPEPTEGNIPYGPHERQVLDFWKTDAVKPGPLLFYIHGGSWMVGDKRKIGELMKYVPDGKGGRFTVLEKYLAAGISVVTINYRYVSQAQEAGVKPPVQWPLQDAARALQLVRSRADGWNIDKNRIAAAGSSAGACSSLWLAFHPDMADPGSADPVARESTRLCFAAVQGAQTTLDPQQMKQWTPNSTYGGHAFGFNGDKANNISSFQQFLDQRESILPWIAEYSPYALATADDPPVFLYYEIPPAVGQAQKDPTHTANFGVKLQEKLCALGVECELAYPGAPGHKNSTVQSWMLERFHHPSGAGAH